MVGIYLGVPISTLLIMGKIFTHKQKLENIHNSDSKKKNRFQLVHIDLWNDRQKSAYFGDLLRNAVSKYCAWGNVDLTYRLSKISWGKCRTKNKNNSKQNNNINSGFLIIINRKSVRNISGMQPPPSNWHSGTRIQSHRAMSSGHLSLYGILFTFNYFRITRKVDPSRPVPSWKNFK